MIEFKKNNFFLNEEANTFLKSIIKNKSLANGYIFYGAEGLGKKQTALQFIKEIFKQSSPCLLYTSPSPRDLSTSRMPSSA